MGNEALKLALEALEAVQRTKVASHELVMCESLEISAGRERLKTRLCEAMHNEQVLRLSAEDALRTALAEPPAVQQEPVARYREKCADGSRCLHGCLSGEACYTAPQPAQQLDDIDVVDLAPAQQKPVATKAYDATTGNTYINFLIDECLLPVGTVFYATSQAAHGIKEDKCGQP